MRVVILLLDGAHDDLTVDALMETRGVAGLTDRETSVEELKAGSEAPGGYLTLLELVEEAISHRDAGQDVTDIMEENERLAELRDTGPEEKLWWVSITSTNPEDRRAGPSNEELEKLEKATGWKIVRDDTWCYLVSMRRDDPFLVGAKRRGYGEKVVDGWTVRLEM